MKTYRIEIWSYGKMVSYAEFDEEERSKAIGFYKNHSMDMSSSAPIVYYNGKKLSIFESDKLFYERSNFNSY